MTKNILTIFSDFHVVCEVYNLVEKTYFDGSIKFKKSSFDNIKGLARFNRHNGSSSSEQLDSYLKKRVKERRGKIVDLALNNNSWQYFITLTFDKKQLGGEYTHDKAIKSLSNWINLQRHQNPGMKYLLVAEFHKNSGHLHFHGLVSNVVNWKLEPKCYPNTNRKIIISGKQIYNLINYKLGFVEVSEIESQDKVSNYISKYVTKELVTLKNKKVFWYSRNLDKPTKSYSYIEGNLKDYLKDENLNYYGEFSTDNRTIEIATCKAT